MSNISENELKNLAVEEAPIGVVVTDATADDNPIIYANEQFTELTGYQRSDVLGRNCRFLQGPETDPEPVSTLRAAVQEERSATVELRNYRKDGSPFWNAVTVSPIENEAGEVTHFVGFQRDVTERLESKQELERERERLDRFAGVVSHDLKNPLNVVRISIETVEETGDLEHLETAKRMVDRMNAMIDDVLVLARQGETVGELSAVDLAPLVEESWGLIESGAATLSNEAGSTILADRDRLAQLLENLLRNAVEHGGADVTVTVGDLDDGFFVEDDGEGIPAGKRGHVFEPGFTTSRDGTGFGLQIVEGVVEAHGWTVSVTEGSDGGARFEVTGVEHE